MEVYSWIKYREHPNPDSGGTTYGDLIYIYPIVEDQGKLTQDSLFPVVVDMNIPCGEKFTIGPGGKEWDCTACIYNDSEDCDVIKYSRALWTTGSIDVAPKPEVVCRYYVDIDSILSTESKDLVLNTDKTIEESALVIERAKKNPVLKSSIFDKLEEV